MTVKKVVWFEGMTLDPHHFQQGDRFHQMNLNFIIRSVVAHSWGIADIKIEKEALPNGQFKVSKLSGIMPDGLIFNMPESDPLPEPRNFSDNFPATQEILAVYLSIPHEKPGSKNCLLDHDSSEKDTRYSIENITVNDDNTGSDSRQIGVAKANFKFVLGTESTESFEVLKIAEIVRSAEGDYALNEEYISPCLSIKASTNLLTVIKRLLEFLVARSNALRSRRKHSSGGQLDVSNTDLPLYWHLSAINSTIPFLNQIVTTGKYHPQQVYETLISLASHLTTFSTDDSVIPGELPVYDHNNLTTNFLNIENKIRKLLGDVVPQKNYIKLDLEKQSESLSVGQIKETVLLKEADFYLLCGGDIEQNKLVNELPQKMRIAAPDMINEVLSTATRALKISHSSHPPAGMPERPGYQFFKLEKQGPFWTAIEKSQSLAVYIPVDFKDLNMEFLAVRKTS